MSRIYGHIEHEYSERFAFGLAKDAAFRSWVLRQTKFAHRSDSQVIVEEMRSLRTSKTVPWWKNHFAPQCSCFGCSGGRETDVFAVFEDGNGQRFALHTEVKQPTDRFKASAMQPQRYAARALCWASNTPRTVPAHSEAATILLCSEAGLTRFANEASTFDAVLTFEQISAAFPNATRRA